LDPRLSWTAREAVAALRRREVAPHELVALAADRIAAVDPVLRAMTTLCVDRAARAAHRIETPDPIPRGYLYGLPIAVKDLIPVAGVRTTWGSRIFADHVSTQSDYEVERLEAKGALIIGKTNTPEFGAGAQTFNDVVGTTVNPWNTALTPGGSSGGSAVALATGQAWLANGTDLGGSLRIPASFTATVGLRPTPGRVPYGPRIRPQDTLSVHGPMARTVGDCALLLDTQAGADPRDPLSYPEPEVPFVEHIDRALTTGRVTGANGRQLSVAWSRDLGLFPVDAETAEVCESAVRRLEHLHVSVATAHPNLSGAEDCFQVLRAELFAAQHRDTLAKYREKLKPEVVWNIEKGLALDAIQVTDARRQKAGMIAAAMTFFATYDILALPTTIVPPFDHRRRHLDAFGDHRFATYVSWLAPTFAITLLGCPALSLPVGFTKSGLPVGLQLVAAHRDEARLLALAALLEADLGLALELPIDPRSGRT